VAALQQVVIVMMTCEAPTAITSHNTLLCTFLSHTNPNIKLHDRPKIRYHIDSNTSPARRLSLSACVVLSGVRPVAGSATAAIADRPLVVVDAVPVGPGVAVRWAV
jgi:hypothetical protein